MRRRSSSTIESTCWSLASVTSSSPASSSSSAFRAALAFRTCNFNANSSSFIESISAVRDALQCERT
eukprot:SAG11_NODE_636_length_8034_cov_5.199118_4_plen_67_part_00